MLVALILHVCLGSLCHDERPPIEITFSECTYRGQIIAQEWLADHPRWELRGWSCQIGKPERGA